MVSWSGGLPVSGWGGPGYPQQPAGRPLLVPGAAITGIAVGVLELLRGLILGIPVVLVGFEVPARVYGLLLLFPLGALALAGGILVLDGRAGLLRWAAAVLVALNLVNSVTYAAAGSGFPAIDLLATVLACVPLFLLAAARPLSR
jgi:hypothetical protein